MPNGQAPGPWKCPRLRPRATKQGPRSPCRARDRGRCRTSRPSPASAGGRRMYREAKPTGIALVVGRRQDDGGRALAQLVGNGERVEQQEVVAELDRVRRYEPRATTPPRSSRDAAIANARHPAAAHAWAQSVTLASGSDNEGSSAFVLKGHSRTLAHQSTMSPRWPREGLRDSMAVIASRSRCAPRSVRPCRPSLGETARRLRSRAREPMDRVVRFHRGTVSRGRSRTLRRGR